MSARTALNYFYFVVLCGLLYFFISLLQNYRELLFISNRIQEDITFNNNQWDTTAYNADPLLPGVAPIYILASDGFVIERWKPIAGFLDASDFKHLLAFDTIQTIQTSSKQDWRVLSLPIKKDGVTFGVVTVSSYHPLTGTLEAFDPQLQEAAQYISSHVRVENNALRATNLDQRTIPHYISFQVVDNLNTIVLKGNNANSIDRLPNFIDPSYVASQLNTFPIKFVRDQHTDFIYLTLSRPLFDETQSSKGVIVVGKSIQPLLLSFFAYLAIALTCVMFLAFYQKLSGAIKRAKTQNTKKSVKFDEKNSLIYIDSTKFPIAYASNQYYLCAATIKHPTKRWEADELLEKMGLEQTHHSWRKIYDAMNQVNKKTQPILDKKLIVLEDKTYRLNPDLL